MLLLVFFSWFFLPSTVLAKSPSVSVTANIHHRQLTIFGYSSPFAKVVIEAPKIYSQTFSDQTGYFEFNRLVLPYQPQEICLTSQDSDSRSTPPLCLSPPPPGNLYTRIGPIVLPPTITLDSSHILPNSTAYASGQSLPDSPIEIIFYQVNQNTISFPKEVSAFSLPIYQTNTDSAGIFSFSLPTSYSSNYRLFASVKYLQEPSPKSNTLTFRLPSFWYLFFLQNWFLIIFVPLYLFTLLLFLYLIYCYLFPSRRYLPVLRHFYDI